MATAREYKVYVHTTPNGKRYVGITQQSLNRRWRNGEGYKPCTYFYKAISKYGWDNITHQVLIDGVTQSQAEALERQFIERWNTCNKYFGYNCRSGGGTNSKLSPESISKMKATKAINQKRGKDHPLYGTHPSALTRERMREAKKGMYFGKNSPSARRVAMISKDGDVIQIFDTLTDAAHYCGRTNISSICEVCRGKQNTAYGYFWRYC